MTNANEENYLRGLQEEAERQWAKQRKTAFVISGVDSGDHIQPFSAWPFGGEVRPIDPEATNKEDKNDV